MRWLVLAVATLLASPAFAQAPIQSSPTELRAAVTCSDTRPAAGSGATATLTPPAGQFVYVSTIEANAAASAGTPTLSTPASLTTTNLPSTFTMGFFPFPNAGSPLGPLTAGMLSVNQVYSFSGNGLKSNAAGTAVTVVAPAVTNAAWHLSLCGYFAP